MNVYEVEQSKNEVQKVYSQLIDKLTEHVKILALNDKPITSVMAIKRALIRMKIDYRENSSVRPEPGERILGREEEMLVMEIMEEIEVDAKEAVCIGLIGIKEMKRTLINYHYKRMEKAGKKCKTIKEELSKKYGYSEAAIEKIVYRTAKKVA